jgi:hypothetical protein
MTADALARAALWNLSTDAGRLDIVFDPSGTGGFADPSRGADRFDVFGVQIQVARLEDLIRSKEATQRARDAQEVIALRELLLARKSLQT